MKVALVLLVLLVLAGPIEAVLHIVIGPVAPESSFRILVNGEEISASPATSAPEGTISFETASGPGSVEIRRASAPRIAVVCSENPR